MAAVLKPGDLQYFFRPLAPDDMHQVMAIEVVNYEFPWTAGNFADSLKEGYSLWAMFSSLGQLVGYAVFMQVVDEVHLLNLSIRREWQSQGLGARLLQKVLDEAKAIPVASVLLEVRPSNLAALRLYRRFDFQELGIRKNYYPAAKGKREDACVMRHWLFPQADSTLSGTTHG